MIHQPPTDAQVKDAILAAVKKGAKNDAEAVRNYREAERAVRAALPFLVSAQHDTDAFHEAVQAERARQIAKGYDAAHDDEHGMAHLLTWAMHYLERGETVKAGALLVAAREALARSVQDEPDWEYGYRALYMASVAAYPGERVKEVLATTRTPESWLPEMGEAYRRTKEIPAGPWAPVADLSEGEEQ